jgi:AhpC/TSA family
MQQLAAFARTQDRLLAEDITTVAASTDPLEKARQTVAEHAVTFPVGYGLPLKETARDLGAFYDPKRGVIHATGFVVRPDRRGAIQLGTDRAPGVAGHP